MGKNKRLENSKIEVRWQAEWNKFGLYTPDLDLAKKPFYNLWMYPYPSAEGLHAGHAFASTGSDIYGRFMRMHGYDVFQPIGYDSFGIHSENFAIKIGELPQKMLERTTKHYEAQLRSLGHGYDWSRTVTTSEPDYYKWTQWLFIKLFKAGLAYKAESKVNWCPSCKTVLADEQVIEGKCERCKNPVEKKEVKQWFFRITDYAERLLENLAKIDWPAKIKLAQKNWIGRSAGMQIEFKIQNSTHSASSGLMLSEVEASKFNREAGYSIPVFTTRPDTLNGATFIVLSPDSPWVEKLTVKEERNKVEEYIKKLQTVSSEEHSREKTGVFTGSYAVNPLTGKEIPIWVADYVVGTYGSGVIMGVPAHDERDMKFAKKFKIEIIDKEPEKNLWKRIEEEGWGVKFTNYHLRDWLISRQRYWGPPIPMIYCRRCANQGRSWFTTAEGKQIRSTKHEIRNKSQIQNSNEQKSFEFRISNFNFTASMAGWYPANEKDLPVSLPFISDYKPKGEGKGPLADHPEFYETVCPACSAKAVRETDVSDTFLDSAWYFLRYPSVGAPDAASAAFNKEITKKWLPVNLYFGGAEHAVLHLMYSRFVTMVLYDLKLIEFEEPFPKFYAHGLLIKGGAKMSKSRGNVVSPDEYIAKFGADTLRLYLMFMGPMDGYPDFRDTGIEGMKRFVDRLWVLFEDYPELSISDEDAKEVNIKMHQTIKKVTEDIENFRYNTAISAIMEFTNVLRDKTEGEVRKVKGKGSSEWEEALVSLALMIAPFAPHTAEEAWVGKLGQKFSIHKAAWPRYDANKIRQEKVIVIIQINGKLRGQLEVGAEESTNQAKIEKIASSDRKISSRIGKNRVKKVIFVPGKLINFVVGAP